MRNAGLFVEIALGTSVNRPEYGLSTYVKMQSTKKNDSPWFSTTSHVSRTLFTSVKMFGAVPSPCNVKN